MNYSDMTDNDRANTEPYIDGRTDQTPDDPEYNIKPTTSTDHLA